MHDIIATLEACHLMMNIQTTKDRVQHSSSLSLSIVVGVYIYMYMPATHVCCKVRFWPKFLPFQWLGSGPSYWLGSGPRSFQTYVYSGFSHLFVQKLVFGVLVFADCYEPIL